MNDIMVWKVIPKANRYELKEIKIADETPSLNRISRMLPGGAYTTFRTYSGKKVIRFSDHLTRLHLAAKLIERDNFDLNNEIIRSALHEIIDCSSASEHRIRLTLDLEQEPGVVYIALEKMAPLPPSAYQQGVKAVTCRMHRPVPKAKLTQFIASANEVRARLPEDVHEALMVAEGKILEGLSSNFFAIKDGVIWTAEEGVLLGVTRSIILEEIRRENIPMHLWGMPLNDISLIEEAFITSSSRGILPIIQIDDQQLGDGKPGPVTQRLYRRYSQRIGDELEDI
jgi:branched-chain amino acid aminotransferase